MKHTHWILVLCFFALASSGFAAIDKPAQVDPYLQMRAADPLELTYVDPEGVPFLGYALGQSSGGERPTKILDLCEEIRSDFAGVHDAVRNPGAAQEVVQDTVRILSQMPASRIHRICGASIENAFAALLSRDVIRLLQADEDVECTEDTDPELCANCACEGGDVSKCTGRNCSAGKKCGKIGSDLIIGYCRKL